MVLIYQEDFEYYIHSLMWTLFIWHSPPSDAMKNRPPDPTRFGLVIITPDPTAHS